MLWSRGSTIGEGGDTTISSPGRSPKQPLPGIGLHDGRQACPEFIAFDQGVGQICPRRRYFRAVFSQNGVKLVTTPPPPNVERVGPHRVPTLAFTVSAIILLASSRKAVVCAPVVDVVVCVLPYRGITFSLMKRSMLIRERPLAVQSASVGRPK